MSTDVMLYVARHGIGTGNEPDAPLSSDGFNQAEQLADFLSRMKGLHVDRLISSPYTRAWQTAEIIEERLKIKLGSPGNRLREQGVRGVTEEESDEMVIHRVTDFVEELLISGQHTFLLVSHRLAITLMLRHYAPDFVVEDMKNPDLFLLKFSDGKSQVKHLWNAGQPAVV
ncbi:histidine phosphatase family protein [Paenibacillus polymyxa]|nr:histidine phosphatase family protein [Paenibacillus polymyxa]